MTITLSSALDRLIEDKVQAGRYASADAFVEQALEREFIGDEVNEWVRARAAEGFAQLDAGASVEMTRHDFVQWLNERSSRKT